MKRVAAFALVLALTAPALGQGIDFGQIVSGKEMSPSLQLKDLNTGGPWWRVSIGTLGGGKGGALGGGGDMMSQLMQIGMLSEMGGKGKDKSGGDAASALIGMSLFGGDGGKEPVYYTNGRTVSLGGETFLVAYRHRKPEMNLMQMAMESGKSGSEPDFAKMASEGKLTPESLLSVTLINARAIGTVSDIRPFHMEQEIAESARSGGLMGMILAEAAKEEKQKAAAPKPKPAAATKPAPRKAPAK